MSSEVPLVRFYSSAPRPYIWTPRVVHLGGNGTIASLQKFTRLEPVESFMAPVMQWASVAQWRQGGAHRGKKVRLPSSTRIRLLEDEAEDFLIDEFGELAGDIEARQLQAKKKHADKKKDLKLKKKMRMRTKLRARLGDENEADDSKTKKRIKSRMKKRGSSRKFRAMLFDSDNEDDQIDAADTLRTLKAKPRMKRSSGKNKKKIVPRKKQLSVVVNKSTRTPNSLQAKDPEDDFRTPHMEKENEANVINTAPPAPRKKKPIMKIRKQRTDDPYDLSDSDGDTIDESDEPVILRAHDYGAKGRRSIKL